MGEGVTFCRTGSAESPARRRSAEAGGRNGSQASGYSKPGTVRPRDKPSGRAGSTETRKEKEGRPGKTPEICPLCSALLLSCRLSLISNLAAEQR